MIDFKSTYDQNDIIHFLNENGETVKTYAMADLESYVVGNGLNITTVSANGCISSDPNIIEEEIETPVTDYINDNWGLLTKEFYNFKNKEDFKSGNTEQETRRIA
jgi:hypothetical protein